MSLRVKSSAGHDCVGFCQAGNVGSWCNVRSLKRQWDWCNATLAQERLDANLQELNGRIKVLSVYRASYVALFLVCVLILVALCWGMYRAAQLMSQSMKLRARKQLPPEFPEDLHDTGGVRAYIGKELQAAQERLQNMHQLRQDAEAKIELAEQHVKAAEAECFRVEQQRENARREVAPEAEPLRLWEEQLRKRQEDFDRERRACQHQARFESKYAYLQSVQRQHAAHLAVAVLFTACITALAKDRLWDSAIAAFVLCVLACYLAHFSAALGLDAKDECDPTQNHWDCRRCSRAVPFHRGVQCLRGHFVCGQCLQQQLEAALADEQLQVENGQLHCQFCECGGAHGRYSGQDLALHLPAELWQRYMSSMGDLCVASIQRKVRLQLQREEQGDQVQRHRRHIVDEILALRCPGCQDPFIDFSGCLSLTCDKCNTAFCALCFEASGPDKDAHVLECRYRSREGVEFIGTHFMDYGKWAELQNSLKVEKVFRYLRRLPDNVQHDVFEACRDDFEDLPLPAATISETSQ